MRINFTRVELNWFKALIREKMDIVIEGINQRHIIQLIDNTFSAATRRKRELQESPIIPENIRQLSISLPKRRPNLNKAKNEGKFRLKQDRVTPRKVRDGDIFLVMRSGNSAPKVIIDLFLEELFRCNIITERKRSIWTADPNRTYYELVAPLEFRVTLKWTESFHDFIYWFEDVANQEKRSSVTRYLRVFKESILAQKNGTFAIKYVWLKELPGITKIENDDT